MLRRRACRPRPAAHPLAAPPAPPARPPCVPPAQVALDDAVNRVRDALASSHDLELQRRSTDNAFRLYCKVSAGGWMGRAAAVVGGELQLAGAPPTPRCGGAARRGSGGGSAAGTPGAVRAGHPAGGWARAACISSLEPWPTNRPNLRRPALPRADAAASGGGERQARKDAAQGACMPACTAGAASVWSKWHYPPCMREWPTLALSPSHPPARAPPHNALNAGGHPPAAGGGAAVGRAGRAGGAGWPGRHCGGAEELPPLADRVRGRGGVGAQGPGRGCVAGGGGQAAAAAATERGRRAGVGWGAWAGAGVGAAAAAEPCC